MKIAGFTPDEPEDKKETVDVPAYEVKELVDIPAYEVEESPEVEQEEEDIQEALKKFQANQLKAANLRSYVDNSGKFKVSLNLEDGTKVVLKTPNGNEIRAQDRIAKKNPNMSDMDSLFYSIILGVEAWGEKNKVTEEEVGRVSDVDIFRLAKGIERIRIRKGL